MSEPETIEGTITEEMAKLLREPFPHVQKVKKEWTTKSGEKKSFTIDYISHAVVTDRLLKVDPSYTWEPLLDERGFPIVGVEGLSGGDSIGVWGRLTLLGSTVVEFCSGKDLLDAYSRCLCRAAMRRGVALDLWIRDDEFKEPVEGARTPMPAVLKTWGEIKAMLAQYGPSMVDEFNAQGLVAKLEMYPGSDMEPLTSEQEQALLKVSAKAATYLRDNYSPDKMPPPGAKELDEAWTHAKS